MKFLYFLERKKGAFFLLSFFLVIFQIQAESIVRNETTHQVYTDLQTAINAASSGDTLKLQGTFFVTGLPFSIEKSLTLKGDLEATLDGNFLNTVLIISESVPNTVIVTLEDLKIQHGNTTGSGGGIDNNANLSLIRTKVTENLAGQNGGGIFNHVDPISGGNSAGVVALIHSKVYKNIANIFGGGIANNGFTPSSTLIALPIPSNSPNATLFLKESEILENFAGNDGGGIWSLSGVITINRSKIKKNVTTGTGGGIFQFTGTTTTINCSEIEDNFSTGDGGGIVNSGSTIDPTSTLIIEKSSLSKNRSLGVGGGLFNIGGASASFIDSRITHNSASIDGGGIFNAAFSIFIFTNTKIRNNTPNDISDL